MIENDLRLGVRQVHDYLALPLLSLVQDLGHAGLPFDPVVRDRIVYDVEQRIKSLDAGLAESGISNASSSKVLERELLHLGLPLNKRTASGNAFTVDLDVLGRIHHHYNVERKPKFPFLPALMERKRLEKARANLESLRPCLDGRLRTALRSTGTETGRYSSAGLRWCNRCKQPNHGTNLQNLGKNNKELGVNVKDCFVAPKGYVLWELDYSMLELRLMAYLANVEKLIVRMEDPSGDVHTENTKAMFDGRYDDKLRTLAKNFFYACVPMDTQALTRQGWRTRDQLNIGDVILTYNAEKGVKEWAPITAFADRADDEIIEMRNNRSFCVRVTKDHRWFVRKRNRKWTKDGTYWAKPYMIDCVQTTEEIDSESNIIVNAPMSVDSDRHIVDAIYSVRQKYGVDWVAKVCAMSQAERRAFLHGFLIADGFVAPAGQGNTSWIWNQNVNELSEAALVASYLVHDGALYVTDRQAVHPMIVCRLSQKSHVTGQKLTKTVVGRGPVWCPVTPNGSWVMRQGNCITITGNCQYGGSEGAIQIALAKKGEYLEQSYIQGLMLKIFTEYPEIALWQQGVAKFIERKRKADEPVVAYNAYGGCRVLLSNDPLKEFLSTVVQGTAAYTMSFALLRLDEEARRPLVIQVHDAFVGCSREEDAIADMRLVKAEMERPIWIGNRFAVLPADGKMSHPVEDIFGREVHRWSDMRKVEF